MDSNPAVTLSMTDDHRQLLSRHLFPNDGTEAVAIGLAGWREGEHTHRLAMREVHCIPSDQCTSRSTNHVTWTTKALVPILERAAEEQLSVIKIHSHRSDFRRFSELDNSSDSELFPCLKGWLDGDLLHCSVIMLPEGEMFGRAYSERDGWRPLNHISVVGPDIEFWFHDQICEDENTPWQQEQSFAEGTSNLLNNLTVGIVGCSGTGSIVIEQLARLGVGKLILVDPDIMEDRNLGRILQSTEADVATAAHKVCVFEKAIPQFATSTEVQAIPTNLWDRDAVEAVGQCDVVFGCVDSHEGRFLLNLIATDYVIPYFDIGVRIVPSGTAVSEVCGTVHYLQPGKSSLVSRGLVLLDRVGAEGLRRNDPEAFGHQLRDGYIQGREVQRPAVVSLNMFAGSLAINDLLARVHQYREESNNKVASIEFSLASLEIFCDPETDVCPILDGRVGRGDQEPLLGLIELAEKAGACQ